MLSVTDEPLRRAEEESLPITCKVDGDLQMLEALKADLYPPRIKSAKRSQPGSWISQKELDDFVAMYDDDNDGASLNPQINHVIWNYASCHYHASQAKIHEVCVSLELLVRAASQCGVAHRLPGGGGDDVVEA